MALENRLVQKLSQNLMMTPQLQQAIKLLTLGRLEYIDAIQNELLENPVLEEGKENEARAASSDSDTTPDTNMAAPQDVDDAGNSADSGPNAKDDIQLPDGSPIPLEDYLEYFSDSHGAATPKGLVDYEDRPSLEATLTRAETLQDHLASQVRFLDLDEEERLIIADIIGNLDKNGYLCGSIEEISSECKCEISEVESVLRIVQQLDPVGIGARDLSECLALQLDARGLDDSLAAAIVKRHIDKLERRKYDLIAREEGVAVERVYEAVTLIKELEPHPGRPFVDDSTRYIVPDIYVQKDGNDYVITLNEDGLPRLKLSPYYIDILRNADSPINSQKSYLNERLKAAQWLIKSMHQRQQTIYRVTESIVKFQRSFLENGISKLKPLVLKDVAEDIGMHESTVSRVTTNKYVHTPQGVFELKFFFSNGIKTSSGDMSSSTIKDKIRAIVAAESPHDPISDQKIVEILKSDNIDIARRTVAKYREGLGIASSSQRKKLF